jgi:hypothetical protein
MAESKFNKRFRAELSAYPFNFRFFRIESHATEPGIPDNHFLRDGYSGWLEMKEEADRVPYRINYRPAQPAWLYSYWKDGGSCGTVLYVRSIDAVLLVRGCDTLRAAGGELRCVAQIVALREEGAWERIGDWITSLRRVGKAQK